jgi:hypothetical protein
MCRYYTHVQKKWRRRKLHPRPQFRKSFLHILLASNMDARGCTMPALRRHYQRLSRTGTACRLRSGPQFWIWLGAADSRGSNWPLLVKGHERHAQQSTRRLGRAEDGTYRVSPITRRGCLQPAGILARALARRGDAPRIWRTTIALPTRNRRAAWPPIAGRDQFPAAVAFSAPGTAPD